MISDEQDYNTIAAKTVYDRDGDKIGHVGQLYLDDETNRPAWVTVNTGLFGTSESFVPVHDAVITGDRLEVPYEKSFIKDAPKIESGARLSRSEEEQLYRYYRMNYRTGGRDFDNREGIISDQDIDEIRERAETASMTAAEERLRVGTEQVEAGRARLRKYVTTKHQTITVPVEKEVLRVEREPVVGDTRRDRIEGDEDVEDIVLREERPVVSKEVHETERVRVTKEKVTDQEQVAGDVQKEHIEVEEEDIRGTEY